MNTVPFVAEIPELRRAVAQWRSAGETVALLPTMGAIHNGHLCLARTGKRQCDRLVTSIFVNPTQFAPEEDFSNYPRTFDTDLAKLYDAGCDLVWAPTATTMYTDGFATTVHPQGAALGLEADTRPHFFAGVATVCCKLFLQAQADIALFGEKDYQQLCVIRQIVRDLDLPLRIVGCETVREEDGLAMSSRNAYLSEEERRTARRIYTVLREVADAFNAGAEPDDACASGSQKLIDAGFAEVDYLAIRDAESLQPVSAGTRAKCRVLVAAWLGETRLIDNIACN
ncbi:MAG: pantoate--beta-alanine ligase [Hyphomicrobiaceae bacterium]